VHPFKLFLTLSAWDKNTACTFSIKVGSIAREDARSPFNTVRLIVDLEREKKRVF
jgi:hypothetical protein